MDVIHVSQEDMIAYIVGDCPENQVFSIEQHLEKCDRCRHGIHEYRVLLDALKQSMAYEPEKDFVCSVTRNIPDLYYSRWIPVFELVTALLFILPFTVSLGLVWYEDFMGFRAIVVSLIHSFHTLPGSNQFLSEHSVLCWGIALSTIFFSVLDSVIVYAMISRRTTNTF